MKIITDEQRPLLDDSSISHTTRAKQRRLWRNAVILNLSALLSFCGSNALASIQSSLNSDQGLGVISMAMGSAFGLLGALMSGVVINLVGCKRAVVYSQLLSGVLKAANFYPAWSTLIPSGAIVGFATTVMVVGHRVYTAQLGHLHSDATDSRATVGSDDAKRTRTQGRFFLFYVATIKASFTVGNLMSSLFLNTGLSPSEGSHVPSLWTNGSTLAPPHCGAAYCNEDLGSDFNDVTDLTRVYGLVGFCVGVEVLGAVIAFFCLDDLKGSSQGATGGTPPISTQPSSLVSVWNTFVRTLALYRNPRLLLIVPTALSLLAMDVFWMTVFTKSFITCSIGMEFIGYVLMWIGLSGAVASVAFGWMSGRLLRRGPLVLGTLTQMSLAIGLLYWVPVQNSLVSLCAYTAAWAFCSGIRHSLFTALISTVFRDKLELAFSSVLMWGSIGNTMILLMSSLLCTDVQIFIVVSLLAFAVITYVVLEILMDVDLVRSGAKRNSNEYTNNDLLSKR